MKFEFIKDVTVEGAERHLGEIVDESQIPAGSMDCLIRMQMIRPAPEDELLNSVFDTVVSDQAKPQTKRVTRK